MEIVELSINDFKKFADEHPLRNYCQTVEYAKVMAEKGYSYEFIGYNDDGNNLIGASLILIKKIGSLYKYGYAPRGFLIDYYNEGLLKMFINDLKDYYNKKNIAFIKINPEIIIGEVDTKNYITNYNQNVNLIDELKSLNFKRRRELEPLDFVLPRINAYINLKEFSIKKLDSEVKNIIKESDNNGLILEKGTSKEIDIFYDFVKNNSKETVNYYRNILNSFKDNAELFLVKVDHEVNLLNAQKQYEKEVDDNNYWNEMIQKNNNEKNLMEKMNSDKRLLKYKDIMVDATDKLRKTKYKYVGGVLVVKYENRVSVIDMGFNEDNDILKINYFIYKSLIEKYEKDYEYLDLNGLASTYDINNDYYNINKPKLDFNSVIYEFIGEFDLIINEGNFKRIQARKLLSKEFVSSKN